MNGILVINYVDKTHKTTHLESQPVALDYLEQLWDALILMDTNRVSCKKRTGVIIEVRLLDEDGETPMHDYVLLDGS